MIEPQRIAADPTISAFVTANAGQQKAGDGRAHV